MPEAATPSSACTSVASWDTSSWTERTSVVVVVAGAAASVAA